MGNGGCSVPSRLAHCCWQLSSLGGCRKNGRFTGFPALGIHWQRTESKALKEAYKLSGPRKGVLVRQIMPIADAAKKLNPDDIIMKFDGIQVASDGTVPFRSASSSPLDDAMVCYL